MSAPAEDDFVDSPSLGWRMPPERTRRERIHADACAVPDAFFADDMRCDCGLMASIDEFASHSDVEIPEAGA